MKLRVFRSPSYDRFSQRTFAAKRLMETSLSVLAVHEAFLPHQFMTEKQISLRIVRRRKNDCRSATSAYSDALMRSRLLFDVNLPTDLSPSELPELGEGGRAHAISSTLRYLWACQ